MKINFTKKEYRNLIDIIYLGDTVLDGALDGDKVDKNHPDGHIPLTDFTVNTEAIK